MHPEAPEKVSRWAKHREESSFLREHIFAKYRGFVGFGVATLVVVDVLEILPPLFLKRAIDVTLASGPVRALVSVALAYLGVAIIQGFCRYGWRMYLIRASLFAGRDLRGQVHSPSFSSLSQFF